MIRRIAVLLVPILALGCQGQSGNPFMRTTVPPPATGDGAPTDPYYNNNGGPHNNAGSSAAVPATGAAPPPGVAPAPAATVPAVPPPERRFSQPGGLNLPQGSINHRKAIDPSPKDYRTGPTTIARAARPRSSGIALATATSKTQIEERTPESTPLEIAANDSTETEENEPLQLADTQSESASVGVTPEALTAETELQTQPEEILIAAANEPETKSDEAVKRAAEPLNASAMSYQTARNILATQAGATTESATGGSVIRIVESNENENENDNVAANTPAPSSTESASNHSAASPAPETESARLTRTLPAGSSRNYVDLSPRKSAQGIRPASYTESALGATTQVAAASVPPMQRSSAPAYSYDPQYAWLRGKLEHSAAANRWKLRYIPIDGQTDKFGGSVVLSNGSQLKDFSPGQMVTVEGTIGNGPAEHGSFSPRFELHRIQPQ